MDDQQPLVVNCDKEDIDTTEQDKNCTKCYASCSLPCRYMLAAMMFGMFFCAFAQRMVFNIALVAMVNLTQSADNKTSDDCPAEPLPVNSTSPAPTGGYPWDAGLQSLLLGAFFYGYPVSQLPGGYLAERFGGKYLFTFVGLSTGALSLLIPVVASWSPYALLTVRALQGLCQGPIYPTCIAMFSRWAPPDERNNLYAMVNSGATLGSVVAMVVAGPLCQSTFLGGWPSTFYLFGGLSVLWALLWTLLIHDTPAVHPRITPGERTYIEKATEGLDTVKYSNPPWLSIIKSPPVWAVFILLCTDGFGFYVTFSCMPLYMRQVLRFDMSQDGLMSALPYLVQFPVTLLVGFMADTIRRRAWLRVVTIRRLAVFIGELMPGVFLVLVGFVGCDKTAAVSMLVLSLAFNSFTLAGPAPALFDIAPLYAGSVMGVLNGISNVAGIVAPLAVAQLTGNSPEQTKWRSVFYLSAAVYALGTIVFCTLISDREQKWAKERRHVEDSDETESGTSHPREIQT